MSDRVVFSQSDDQVGVVSLNRPDKLNAMDQGLFDGLHDAATQAEAAVADGSVRAVLIRGKGRAFSAGLDVTLFGGQVADGPPEEDWIAHLQAAFTRWEDLAVPVIAAVRGVALGGGCQLALAAHMRLATPDAQLALLEANWAIIPDLGGLTRLPRLIGLSRATDMAMTARRIDAQTALQWGLVDQILPEDDFDDAAHDYVRRLAAGPTRAIGAVPGLLRQAFTTPRDDMLAAERRYQRTCLTSADFIEAATAAMGNRAPDFTGR